MKHVEGSEATENDSKSVQTFFKYIVYIYYKIHMISVYCDKQYTTHDYKCKISRRH